MISKCLDKLKEYHGFKKDSELEKLFGLKQKTIYSWRNFRQDIPLILINHLKKHALSLDEYLGSGIAAAFAAEHTPPWNRSSDWTCGEPDPETADLICKARRVLTSGSAFADVLKLNIATYYQEITAGRQPDETAKKNTK